MYEMIVVLKALTEVAGVAMIGQGVLYAVTGNKRDQNFAYVIFKTITSPVLKVTRWITPRVILDRHLGLVAFFLLIVLWLGLTVMKIGIVLENTPPAS
jgi:ABC-type uncharacterized transport system permease subunit